MSSTSTSIPGMRFTCDRTWETMALIEGGRFCDGCQKTVIDFTAWSNTELQAWFRSGAIGCGRFEVHQIDPTLVPLEEIGRGVRRGVFAAIAAFAIGNAQAQVVQPAASTELVDSLSHSRDVILNARVAAEARNPKLEREVCLPIARQPMRKAKGRVYLSWRFPFVHRYTRPHRMGFF